MGDQGSTYSALQDVPLMISPQYKLPKPVRVQSEFRRLLDNVLLLDHYRFAVEKQALADIKEARRIQREQEEVLEKQRKEYQEALLQRQKLAARKIAPGFLDTDTRILKPEPFYSQAKSSLESDPATEESQADNTHSENDQRKRSASVGDEHVKSIDYLKFEQGLAPPDPWDTPENDLAALRSIWGSPENKHAAAPANRPPGAGPYDYQNTQGIGYATGSPQYNQVSTSSYASDGYWARNPASKQHQSYPPVQAGLSVRHASMPVAPALPPKPYFDSGSPSPMHTSPHDSVSAPVSHSGTPPLMPRDYRIQESNYNARVSLSGSNSPTIAPPLPPPPGAHAVPEDLLQELINMGFSRTQAIDALEKNDNDLTKATNFLLDQANG